MYRDVPTLKYASRSDFDNWVSRNTRCQRSGRIPLGSSELFQLIISFNDFQFLFIVHTPLNYFHVNLLKTHFTELELPVNKH